MTGNNFEHYADKLGAMIRIPTVSQHNDGDLTQFYIFHKELERLFPLVHANLQKIDLNATLLFHWKGSDSSKRPILLMGHQDIVPASDTGWVVPAYSGEVVDGKIYGRGAIDCKGHLFTILQAIEELLEENFVPPYDIYIESSINEEIGGDGAPGAAKYLEEHGIKPAIIIDEAGSIVDEPIAGIKKPFAVIGVTEKGYMDLKISAKGIGGHSSTPPRKTPAARLFAFANEIERKRPFKKVLLPEAKEMLQCMGKSLPLPLRILFGNIGFFKPVILGLMPKVTPFGEAILATTCCFTMMKGSDAPNVIAKEPYLVANLRTALHQDCEASLAVMRKYAAKYDLKIEVLTKREPSPMSDIHSKEYAYLTSCIKKQFPDVGVAPYIIMGATDCRHFSKLTSNAFRFSPLRTTVEQINSCHGVDENVSVTALEEGVQFFKEFMKGWNM